MSKAGVEGAPRVSAPVPSKAVPATAFRDALLANTEANEALATKEALSPPSAAAQEAVPLRKAVPVPEVPEPYRVRRGDTLWAICRERLKSAGSNVTDAEVHEAVREAARVNRLANPDLIFPGQKLGMPVLSPFDERPRTPLPEPVVASAKAPTLSHTPVAPTMEPDENRPAIPAPVRNARPGSPSMTATLTPAPQLPPDAPEPVRLFASMDASILAGPALVNSPGAYTGLPKPESPWSAVLDGAGRLTSGFGMRKDPFTGRPEFHTGIDIAARIGTPVRPYARGVVTFTGWDGGYGQVVVVRHANGLETKYGHTSKNLVRLGQPVTPDTVIAEVGTTGRSTGPHLHFEMRRNGKPIDPVTTLTKRSIADVT